MKKETQYGISIIISFFMIPVFGIIWSIFDPEMDHPILIIPMLLSGLSCCIFAFKMPTYNKEKSASELLNDEKKKQ